MTTPPGSDLNPESVASTPPGIYSGVGSATGLRYWNGNQWDPRPVARTWTRVWCTAIDNVLASILWFILAFVLLIPFVFLDPSGDNPIGGSISIVALIVAFVGYFAVSYRLWGRTPGMMLGRLWVIHIPTGQSKLSWGNALGRAAGLILGYACGIFTIIWLSITASSRAKQGPHDSWARTGVLVDPPVRPSTTHLVSGSAASVAATRGSSPAPPASPPSPPPPKPGAPYSAPTAQAGFEPAADPPAHVPATTSASTNTPPDVTTEGAPGPLPPTANPQTTPRGVRQRRSRLGLAIGILVTLAVLVTGAIVAALYVDSRMRANTLEELLAAVDVSEAVIEKYNTDPRFNEFADTLRKAQALEYQPEEFHRESWRIFVDSNVNAANEYVAPMQRAILNVEAVDPLPWHGDLIQARAAYLDHANTWMDAVVRRTEHTASDQEVPDLQEGLDARISSTWTIAQRRFLEITFLWMPRDLYAEVRENF